MHISAARRPKMSMGLTKSSFGAIRIPNISDEYPNGFRYVGFSTCPNLCSNVSFLILNFFFIPNWKSKVAKLFDTTVQWIVGCQLHIAILCIIEYLEVRGNRRS